MESKYLIKDKHDSWPKSHRNIYCLGSYGDEMDVFKLKTFIN